MIVTKHAQKDFQSYSLYSELCGQMSMYGTVWAIVRVLIFRFMLKCSAFFYLSFFMFLLIFISVYKKERTVNIKTVTSVINSFLNVNN